MIVQNQMTREEIENTELYKALSKMSNKERGCAFDKFKDKIESSLDISLVKHNYTELGKLEDNPKLSFEDQWQACGPICFIMEFKPN